MTTKIDKDAIAWARSRMDAEKFGDVMVQYGIAGLIGWFFVACFVAGLAVHSGLTPTHATVVGIVLPVCVGFWFLFFGSLMGDSF